ncbi:MAG: Gfo/Idh/MocA family oxidoreductase [Candidatus Latescibacterota bacterium]|nr:Gfo/Idh/MocA family oxidoreductase [Candidatus Latescibacterota bacterium]
MRVRMGVVGCGAIAQVQHLPNLAALSDRYEISTVCDVSASLARSAAEEFGVDHYCTSMDELLGRNLDAVLLCQNDPKTEVALQVLDSGRHLFIEKPVCFTVEDADAMVAAANRAGVVAQAGYMKVFDPGFVRMESEVAQMGDSVRFVQINHLHTDNRHHVLRFNLRQADDLPADAGETLRRQREADVRRALGENADARSRGAFFHLAGSMIHDLYGLRHLFGMPKRVVSTEIWNRGWGFTTILEFGAGHRCAATWVELVDIRHFHETLEVYADDHAAILSYPTGFSRGIPSQVEIRRVDAERAVTDRPVIAADNVFLRELEHFHDCIHGHAECRTPLSEARDDVALIVDIVRRYLEG